MGVLHFHLLRREGLFSVAMVAGPLPVVWTTMPQTGFLRFPPRVFQPRGDLIASELIFAAGEVAPSSAWAGHLGKNSSSSATSSSRSSSSSSSENISRVRADAVGGHEPAGQAEAVAEWRNRFCSRTTKRS